MTVGWRIREGMAVAKRNRLGVPTLPTRESLPGHCERCRGRVYLMNLRWVDMEGWSHTCRRAAS